MMFARIMCAVLAIILLLTATLTVTGTLTLRNQQINARLDALTERADDIAWLASQSRPSRSILTLWDSWNNENEAYLNRAAAEVYEEYGAYIVVVDRRGNIQDNFRLAVQEDPDFVASLDNQEIREALIRILGGETIQVRTMVAGNPVFTVGVPYVRENEVQGAVFIQTRAQRIESGLGKMLWRSAVIAFCALLLAGLLIFLVVRQALNPLKKLTKAASDMGNGNLNARVGIIHGPREIRALGSAFDTMAAKLCAEESGRKEFVANVSHELKSPITSIRGFVEGMADGVIPPEEHPKYLQLVAEESKRLSGLIADLLALSRLEQDDVYLDLRPFDMNEMLRRAVIRRINDLDGKNLDVDCDFGDDPCPVNADPDRIEQVVVNLLDNAIKFTPTEGKITLQTRADGQKCTIIVADNGPAIPAEDREKIFDRFFTSDRAHTAGKGTGLGLPICQRILAMHGGEVRLLDTEEGTAFAFMLPIASEAVCMLPDES